MQLLEIAVRKVKQAETKYGQRTVIECINYGEEIAIWRGANDEFASHLQTGDFITVAVDSKGKYSLVENPQVVKSAPETTAPVCDRYIDDLAAKMAQCVRAMRAQLPDLDEDTIQKYSVSLFIQVCKGY